MGDVRSMVREKFNNLIYENPLSNPKDIEGFRLEGSAAITFPRGRMRMENLLNPSEGQKANFVLWCPEDFPGRIRITWDFWPIYEPGLCILFFAAKGIGGQSIFDPSLKKRTGEYEQYHHGDINAYHISYFRRKWEDERRFHTCNLRKSYGFHLVAQGADPIPSLPDAQGPYSLELIKDEGDISFYINDLLVLHWRDDGKTYGPVLQDGKIGFRQMAPLIAEYANLRVYTV